MKSWGTKVMALVVGVALWYPTAYGARCGSRDDEAQTPWRQLTWEDYRAKMSSRRSSTAADTKTGLKLVTPKITTEEEADGWLARPSRICIYAVMYKLESGYAFDGKNKRNLAHGQTRFDLTEVFARRFYQEVSALELRGPEPSALESQLRRQIGQRFREMLREWRETMELHNEETDYGRKRMSQKKWQKQVGLWLEELPPVTP